MAMLPEVHVSLDRLAIQHIYQLFLPLVPGGTLVIGLCVAYQSPLASPSVFAYLGRVAAVCFFAFAVGLMLTAVSTICSGVAVGVVQAIVFRNPRLRPSRSNRPISQNPLWRTVAAAFLDKLAPTPPPPNATGSGIFISAAQFLPGAAPPNVVGYDVMWNDWYNILQDYVLRGRDIVNQDILFAWVEIQATAWAFAFLSLYPALGRHWTVFFISAVIILFAALMPFVMIYNYWKTDRLTPLDFIARLLAEIKGREDKAAPPTQ